MVVQAIARPTATTSEPRDLAARFTERLNGIAATNALLVSGKECMITGTLGGCAVLEFVEGGAIWMFKCASSSVLEDVAD